MRFDASQQMQVSQQMRLAPRMIASMEILQMPALALQERIEQELESNIALEQVEPDERETEDGEQSRNEALEREAGSDDGELVVGGDNQSADDWERLSNLESNYAEAFDNQYSSSQYSSSRLDGERDSKMEAMANVAAREQSLTEQLLHQWSFAEVDPTIAKVGERIIGYIDSDGLLGADLQTIYDQNPRIDDVEVTMDLLAQALRAVQHWLDPPGIAARDPREALLLQLDTMEVGEADQQRWTDARMIICDYYQQLLDNRLPAIAQDTGLSMQRIHDAIELLKHLNLTPGLDLVDEDVPPIIPDVIVEYDERSDSYFARLSGDMIPPLRVSNRYAHMAKDRSLDKQTREFVGNSVRNANWLIEAIQQRNNTLLRVVNVVLARQRDFLDYGPQHLKALPMIEVADQLGVHVATVSRAVADKWIQTPRGMFPLRRFFSGGRETASGRDMSWEAVKATLKEIIDSEDKAKPFSDEALARELQKRGIDIARRTVVKYRQQLGIPPARRRKQHV